MENGLLLALGNDILGDDGVAWEVARRLEGRMPGWRVECTAETGIALMELMSGYACCVLLDAFETDAHPPGTLLQMTRDDFRVTQAPSPHYCGLPEMFATAERLGLPMPAEVRVLGICVPDARTIRDGLSPELIAYLDALAEQARGLCEGM